MFDPRKIHEKPCAAAGLVSYRFTTERGTHVMIGAKSDRGAMGEARRSTREPGTLYIWSNGEYTPRKRLEKE